MALRPAMHLLKLRGVPIFDQLRLEERLLRTTSENWCIFNDGTVPPTIVMGISGNAETLLDAKLVVRDRVNVVRRFSGGGTVVVDENTLFVTMICSRDAFPSLPLFAGRIMDWTAEFYNIAFTKIPGFGLKQQDYAIEERKFGGNAQAITKDRWLHHTSFLWDYSLSRMAYLKLPSRAPDYRRGRSHEEFVCRLKDHLPRREDFQTCLETGLRHYFSLQERTLDSIDTSTQDYIHSSKVVPLSDIEALVPENELFFAASNRTTN